MVTPMRASDASRRRANSLLEVRSVRSFTNARDVGAHLDCAPAAGCSDGGKAHGLRISWGVRHHASALRKRVDRILERRKRKIEPIFAAHHVPQGSPR
jgi:hypothetical protein